jgi:hypothetical protein
MMASRNSTQAEVIEGEGFEPVTVNDIECLSNMALEQAETMAALFRTIARLTDDRDIKSLCNHGALQAELQANDIDLLFERAMKAGFAASKLTAV